MFKNFDKNPIKLNNIEAELLNNILTINKENKISKINVPTGLNIKIENQMIRLSTEKKVTNSDEKKHIGTFVANLRSGIKGLEEGHKKTVKFTGTKAYVDIKGQVMEMRIGLSHSIQKKLPDEVKAAVLSNTSKEIIVEFISFSKELVGKISSELVSMIKNPYEGGVHIQDLTKPKVFKKRRQQKNA